MGPFLSSVQSVGIPESIGNFYSPYDSAHNSDDDECERVNICFIII